MLDRHILFLATSKPDDSRAFYADVMSFDFVADEDFALVFDADGMPLRIQKVPAHTPLPYTVLGWDVDDIEASVSSLIERGVKFEQYEQMPQDERDIWEIPDVVKVAWFRDPDGNTLSLTQQLAGN